MGLLTNKEDGTEEQAAENASSAGTNYRRKQYHSLSAGYSRTTTSSTSDRSSFTVIKARCWGANQVTGKEREKTPGLWVRQKAGTL